MKILEQLNRIIPSLFIADLDYIDNKQDAKNLA